MQCHACGQDWTGPARISRSDLCARCGRPLKCCLNCTFYDPDAHHQCREPEAEFVSDKEAANFCDWFRPSDKMRQGSENHTDRTRDAKKKLDQLFGK